MAFVLQAGSRAVVVDRLVVEASSSAAPLVPAAAARRLLELPTTLRFRREEERQGSSELLGCADTSMLPRLKAFAFFRRNGKKREWLESFFFPSRNRERRQRRQPKRMAASLSPCSASLSLSLSQIHKTMASISRCGGPGGCPERAIMKRPKTGEQVRKRER